MNSGPVFIAGISSSGKTLLRLALSSHPNLAISRRTYMWTRFYNRFGDLSRPDNFERCLTAMLAHKPTWALRPDPERIRKDFWRSEPTYARLFALFHEHFAEGLGRPRWGDQLGFVEHYADVIFSAYPGAQMIHMVRDPRDSYAASVSSPRRRPGAVGAATAAWTYSVTLAERNRRRYPDRYKVVHCEALLSHPEETLRDICAFLGEPFVPTMLTFEGALAFGGESNNEPGGSSGLLTAARWQLGAYGKPVSRRELTFIQRHTRRQMTELGYEPEPVRLSLPERLQYYAVDWPANMAGVVAGRALFARRLTR